VQVTALCKKLKTKIVCKHEPVTIKGQSIMQTTSDICVCGDPNLNIHM